MDRGADPKTKLCLDSFGAFTAASGRNPHYFWRMVSAIVIRVAIFG